MNELTDLHHAPAVAFQSKFVISTYYVNYYFLSREILLLLRRQLAPIRRAKIIGFCHSA
jgi:hypothetical protein